MMSHVMKLGLMLPVLVPQQWVFVHRCLLFDISCFVPFITCRARQLVHTGLSSYRFIVVHCNIDFTPRIDILGVRDWYGHKGVKTQFCLDNVVMMVEGQ